MPFVRVAAWYRGRAGSPRRALGEVYQALVSFKERRDGWAEFAAPLARGLAASVRSLVAAEARGGSALASLFSTGGDANGVILTPVPSYRGRRPHVRMLTALAAAGLPAVDLRLDLLVKTADVVQKGLSRAERRRESRRAYALRGRWRGAHAGVRGRVVVITDDFMTTGATFEACARVLTEAGAAAVYGAAVVRVLRAPAERMLTLGARQLQVQMRELDARGRAAVSSEDGSIWVRFACSSESAPTCPIVHTAGPYPLPTFDRQGVHRWVCRCGASHDIRLRREWLGDARESIAVGVGARRAAELLVGIVQGRVTYV